MPDVIQMLLDDHSRARKLFRQFEHNRTMDVALSITDDLAMHTAIEEDILYPLLDRVQPGMGDAGRRDHDEVKGLIEQVEALEEDDPAFFVTVKRLIRTVEAHMIEEEEAMLPSLARLEEERFEAGLQVYARKQELLNSPERPALSPSVGTANTGWGKPKALKRAGLANAGW